MDTPTGNTLSMILYTNILQKLLHYKIEKEDLAEFPELLSMISTQVLSDVSLCNTVHLLEYKQSLTNTKVVEKGERTFRVIQGGKR